MTMHMFIPLYDQNMEMHKVSLSYDVEISSVHCLPALWQTLTLNSMRQHLWTEKSAPIDTILQLLIRKLPCFEGISCKMTYRIHIFSNNEQI